jgi:hypothetical protein
MPQAAPRLLRPAKPELACYVVDNLPDYVPVTRREIEIIETYLAALLDDAMEGMETQARNSPTKADKRS